MLSPLVAVVAYQRLSSIQPIQFQSNDRSNDMIHWYEIRKRYKK